MHVFQMISISVSKIYDIKMKHLIADELLDMVNKG